MMKMWPDIGGGMIPADPEHHMLIAGTLLLIAGTKHHMPYGIATYLVDVHLSTSESQSIKCDKGFVVAIVDKHPNTARQLGGEHTLYTQWSRLSILFVHEFLPIQIQFRRVLILFAMSLQ
jgi:hypothetical protein